MRTLTIAIVVLGAAAARAHACSVIAPLPTPAELVHRADVIVIARAIAVGQARSGGDPFTQTTTEVEFAVEEVLKGDRPDGSLKLNGLAVGADDRNDRPVPYDFVRRAGRRGNCYALDYRLGAKYLLLLKRSNASGETIALTPYWSPLAPTNEQLFGADDPWRAWVSAALTPRKPSMPSAPAARRR